MCDLLMDFVIDITSLVLRCLNDLHEQVVADEADEDVAETEFEFAFSVSARSHFQRHLTVLNNFILSILLADEAQKLCWCPCDRLQRGLHTVFMREANLDWVQNFVEGVIDADNLNVFVASHLDLHLLVFLEGFDECTVTVRGQLEGVVRVHHDQAIFVHVREHLLLEKDE